MTDLHIPRCERCQAPVSVKQHVDGRTLTLDAHPRWQPTPGAYVVLPNKQVANASWDTVHVYRPDRCGEDE